MTKLICDFCNWDVSKVNRIKVPVPETMEAFGGRGNVPFIKISDKVSYAEQDICDSCAKKMMKALVLMKFIEED